MTLNTLPWLHPNHRSRSITAEEIREVYWDEVNNKVGISPYEVADG